MRLKILNKIARKILALELIDEYMKGFADGVNQHLHEADTVEDVIVSAHEYWTGEVE